MTCAVIGQCFYSGVQAGKKNSFPRNIFLGRHENSFFRETTHREIFLKFYQIKPKSDCIYHFMINLESNGRPLVPNQLENGKCNRISV